MIDRIYFLTLNESNTRKNNVIQQIVKLRDAGFYNCEMFKNYKFPRAISGALKSHFRPRMGEGIYSCLTGHYAIMNDALNNGYDHIMIFEDDVHISDEMIEHIKSFQEKYNDLDFDCVKLYYFLEGLSEEEFNKYKYDWIDNELFRFHELPQGSYVWGNQWFVVSKKLMKAYIEYFDNDMFVADRPMCDHKNFIDKYDLKIYVHKNTSILQKINTNSTIYF